VANLNSSFLAGFSASQFPRLAASNTFAADQTINGTVSVEALNGPSTSTGVLDVQATDTTTQNVAIGGLANGPGGTGVYGEADIDNLTIGVWGRSSNGEAGHFDGNVDVVGSLTKTSGSFKIDDPIDPANKYLYHSFVESPDMKNVYDGVATLDGNGESVVQLPDWFQALNRDYRYQLTCIGGFAPVYIAEEVNSNQFKIAGGKPGMRVSWQVTGIRQDAWANAHRIPVEEMKPEKERGYYLHPELFGAPNEKSINWAQRPELMRRISARRAGSVE